MRENGQVICYSWSVAEKKWVTLGNVISGSGGSTETSGKVLYEGKVSLIVFPVFNYPSVVAINVFLFTGIRLRLHRRH